MNIDGVTYLTVKEVAEILDVTPSRVRQLIMRGRLSSRRVGLINFIPLQSIIDFVPKPIGRPVTTGAGLRWRQRRLEKQQ